jgi:hypothetical protein
LSTLLFLLSFRESFSFNGAAQLDLSNIRVNTSSRQALVVVLKHFGTGDAALPCFFSFIHKITIYFMREANYLLLFAG